MSNKPTNPSSFAHALNTSFYEHRAAELKQVRKDLIKWLRKV